MSLVFWLVGYFAAGVACSVFISYVTAMIDGQEFDHNTNYPGYLVATVFFWPLLFPMVGVFFSLRVFK